MIKIIFTLAILVVCVASYLLYRQEQQHKQHVAVVVSEAQSSLQHVQQNPYYHRQPIQTRRAVTEEE